MNKYFYLAAALVAFAACTNDDFVGGDNTAQVNDEGMAIVFNSGTQTITRADHYGADAAALLNNKFIVGGFKGATGTSTAFGTDGSITTAGVPATGMVFDNYQVKWTTNTAGTTQSNTSDWEYVGLTALAPSTLKDNTQSIKFWDYTSDQYDFIAYSTSDAEVITTGDPSGNKVLVSAINAANAGNSASGAYTLKGDAAALEKCYIADMVTAYKTGAGMSPAQPKFQDEINFEFRALASKVRVALYETVPGYSVKNVKFYKSASTKLNSTTEGDKVANATLFSTGTTDNDYFYTAGEYKVYFPTIGVSNISKSDYNKAHLSFTATGKGTTKDFSTLNYTSAAYKEKTTGNVWLGRSAAAPSFAGASSPYYQIAMPNEVGTVLELRVDYTLESVDGSGEEINVYGATAYVPAIYATWKSGYAYTYIFKISDNTNGWTNMANAATNSTDPAGLYPITFDAVVQETTESTQSTITEVATPSITTYQKNHVYTDNEYDATKGAIFVQVMSDGTLKTDLNSKGKLYEVAATNAKDKDGVVSEAEVMDALNIVDASGNPMNGWTLTAADPAATYPTVIPGADGNNITVTANSAAQFTPTAGKVYAYVYTVSTGTASNVGVAVTLTTAPTDWNKTSNVYYSDAACTSAVNSDFVAGVYYQKRYVNNNNVYGVKLIRVKASS